MGVWATGQRGWDGLFRLGFFLTLLVAAVGPAAAQGSPVPNFGFESGNLQGWTSSCFGEEGGCNTWTVSAGTGYARTGLYGARLFNAQVGRWGHAQFASSWFTDRSLTYTFPLKLVGGTTQFYSGLILFVQDSTGRTVRYQGNALGIQDFVPPDAPNRCGQFRLVPGEWIEYTFDFEADFLREHGQMPTSTRRIILDAYQDNDYCEVYLDDLLVPRTQRQPVTVAGLSLSRSTVTSAESVTGEVTLTGPAPAEGAWVTITSRNQAVIAPPSLYIPGGVTRGSFNLPISFAPTPREGWITATYGAAGRTAPLTVNPGPVTTLAVKDATVLGGSTTTGTVQLLAPVGPVRLDLTLASSDPAVAAVPERVAVTPGNSAVSFPITTTAVTGTSTVFLTAASPAGVATVRLDVGPPTAGQPGSLAGLLVSPEGVTGGRTVTATVLLSGPAPSGGAVVALTTDASDAVAVPASVTVPAGANFTTVELAATPVASRITATITASYAGRTQSAAFTVHPPAVAGITVAPLAVMGGEAAAATVTLTGPAPATGTAVALSSAAPGVAGVPATVMVPAGATSVNVTVTTATVTAATPVAISAAANGAATSAALTVAPSGTLWLAIQDNQLLGSRTANAIVKLIGPPPAQPTEVTLSSSNPSVAAVPAQLLLAAGENTATFLITSTPVPASSTIGITARAGNQSVASSLVVLPPQLSTFRVQPAALRGGETATGTVELTGPAPAGGLTITIQSENPGLATAAASVVVPAGVTSGSFPIGIGAVAASSYVSLGASFGGRTRTATLILQAGVAP